MSERARGRVCLRACVIVCVYVCVWVCGCVCVCVCVCVDGGKKVEPAPDLFSGGQNKRLGGRMGRRGNFCKEKLLE